MLRLVLDVLGSDFLVLVLVVLPGARKASWRTR
jgi:hypothetical protein